MKIVKLLASLSGFLLVVAGAAGAHLGDAGDPRWQTALLFGLVHVLAALHAADRPNGLARSLAAWLLLAGGVIFPGTLFANVLTGGANPLAALAPVGGLAMMAGWLALAVAALRSRAAV